MSKASVSQLDTKTLDEQSEHHIEGYKKQSEEDVLLGIQAKLAQTCDSFESRLPKIRKNIIIFLISTFCFIGLGIFLGLKAAQRTSADAMDAVLLLSAPALISLLLASYSSLRYIKMQNMLAECRTTLAALSDKIRDFHEDEEPLH